MTGLIQRTTIREIVGHRDAAVAKMAEAARLIAQGHALADEAAEIGRRAHGAAIFTGHDHAKHRAFGRLFKAFDAEASTEAYRRAVDARVWMHLMTLTGMDRMMDRTAKEELERDLAGDVPPVTEETAWTTFERLAGDAALIFRRGLARAFIGLDRRFRSHDGFKIGARVVLTNVFDAWGSWNYHARMRDTLTDIERVFCVLDGQPFNGGEVIQAVTEARRGGLSPRQSVTETTYFRVKGFKNGNAHLWFTRDDLVEKANLELAAYYGEVLADAVPEGATEADLRSHDGALCHDLQFYPTPAAVAQAALRLVHVDGETRALEPSAGEGAMVRALLDAGVGLVDAIEVHPARAAAVADMVGTNTRASVTAANFLRTPPRPVYDLVLMNPPFFGTHWMAHVTHAYDFLAPGGKLVAVLPATAEIGDSRKHVAFRKWAEARTGEWGSMFRDLPAESFAESGTRVSTVLLYLRRAR